MNHLLLHNPGRTRTPRAGEHASARSILPLAVVFLLGIAVSAVWFCTGSKHGKINPSEEPGGARAIQLSDSTRAVLSRLNSPLEIRFYALLDTATVPESVTALAGRIAQLLSDYQQQAGGKIKLTTFNPQSNLNPNAAAADGMQAFNLDKGDVCFLGVSLVLDGRKETLPRLSPEWEQALEPDLTRAIVRLVDAPHPAGDTTAISLVNTAAIQEVKALLPNLAAVSLQEGKKTLQEAALRDFTAAAKEMEAQVRGAQQRLSQAQNSGSETSQLAAMKYLQQVQAEQTERLKQIAARSKAQTDALQQIKASAQ